MQHLERNGRYFRVADRHWVDPLSSDHSQQRGGRWNPPGEFGAIYLNSTRSLARKQLRAKLEPRGIRPEDLHLDTGPDLVHTDLPPQRYVDAVTAEGLATLGLPPTYPLDARGQTIPRSACHPIGRNAWEQGEPGVACRSAVSRDNEEELAYFRGPALQVIEREPFAGWFWHG